MSGAEELDCCAKAGRCQGLLVGGGGASGCCWCPETATGEREGCGGGEMVLLVNADTLIKPARVEAAVVGASGTTLDVLDRCLPDNQLCIRSSPSVV